MNNIIQRHKRFQDIQDEWNRKEVIRREVKLEFAQKFANERSFWKRLSIRWTMKKTIKKRIDAAFPPHALHSTKTIV